MIEAVKGKILGVVLNNVDLNRDGYYYAYCRCAHGYGDGDQERDGLPAAPSRVSRPPR